MIDTIWSMLIPGALSVWNVIIMRTYFQTTIPQELLEASQLDGCTDFRFLWRIVLPLGSYLGRYCFVLCRWTLESIFQRHDLFKERGFVPAPARASRYSGSERGEYRNAGRRQNRRGPARAAGAVEIFADRRDLGSVIDRISVLQKFLSKES